MRLDRKTGHAYLLHDCLFTDITKRGERVAAFQKGALPSFQSINEFRNVHHVFLQYNNNNINNNNVLVNVLMSDCYSS